MSESMWNNGPDDPEFFERVAAKEKAEKLKAAQEFLDNFIKKDRILDQNQLDRESEKFDDWMRSDSFKRFVEATWTVFSEVDSDSRGLLTGWLTHVQDAFDIDEITASIAVEAYFYTVTLHIRCKDGKLYDYVHRYDKAEFLLMETFSDKKLDLFRKFFSYENMRKVKELSTEIKLKHPFTPYDRSEEYYEKDRVTPVSELPEPAKMDPEKFKKICDQLDKEAEENLTLKEAARRGNWNADTFKRQTGRGLFEF